MESVQPREHAEFTIGWVCALPVELEAARASLDEILPTLPAVEGDTNHYIFGRIGPHNVVIATLPSSSYGTVSAACVATHMERSFRRLRFGLMVGIGGGVPHLPNDDIRLGDVVVSDPNNLSSGLVQYDLGKTREGHERPQRTGTLNKPPLELLNAIAGIKSRQSTEPALLASRLQAMRQRDPAFASKLTYPGARKDVLFEAGYRHRGQNDSCEHCLPGETVVRPERSSSDPHVHYGTIASGNQVIKDSLTREYWQQQEGILCFDMAAAGLESFRCLVIRGVCDYADSHKNKEWQLYAAAVAASYAKDLLLEIPPLEVSTATSSAKKEEQRHWGSRTYNSGGGPQFNDTTFNGPISFTYNQH